MSYQGQESSISGGAPRELYRFVQGATRWLLTNLATSYTYQGETYEPAAVRRGAPEIGQDIARAGIEVRLPRDQALASLLVATPADASVSLTIYRMHITDSASEVIVYWRGRVAGARLTGSELALRCEPLLASMRRVGPRALLAHLPPRAVLRRLRRVREHLPGRRHGGDGLGQRGHRR
jgi:hypothetical protein